MKYLGNAGTRMAAAALAVVFAVSQPITAHARGGGGGFHGGVVSMAHQWRTTLAVALTGAVSMAAISIKDATMD
jgi:hypothetical protein